MAKKLPAEFGAALRELRTKKGLKIVKLAEKVGVSPVYITQIEKHNKLPSPSVMLRIYNEIKQPWLLRRYLKLKYPELQEILSVIGKAGLKSGTAGKVIYHVDGKKYKLKKLESN